MKNVWRSIFTAAIYLYIIVASIVFVPYYNWTYAKRHGFVKWILFGEIVATGKAAAWPYFVFFGAPVDGHDSPDANHFRNSKKAYDEALAIVDKSGDVTRLPPDLRGQFADLLRLAIAEANQVQLPYL